MTGVEKKKLDTEPTMAYWSELGGVEVKKIEYGIQDYVLCISGTFSGKRKYHRAFIHYVERPYIVILRTKLYLDECLKS